MLALRVAPALARPLNLPPARFRSSPSLSLGRCKLLHTLAREDLPCVDDAFRIYRDHVQPKELARILAHTAHLAHDFAIHAIEEPNVVIRQIGNVQVLLSLVRREHDAACGTTY